MGTALITGATSGIGLEFAWELASEGMDLVLVARTRERLEEVATKIEQLTGASVEVLSADLSTLEGATLVADRIRSLEEPPVTLVINNAGFGLGQEFLEGTIERELEALNAMVRAVLVISHAAAQVMAKRGRGGILNVSSMTSLTAQGTYSAHKAWVRTFTEGLAASLRGTDVRVSALCPGLVHTEFHERAKVDPKQWAEIAFASPGVIARAGIDGLRRGKVIITPTLLYKALAGVLRFTPRFIVRRVAGPELCGRI